MCGADAVRETPLSFRPSDSTKDLFEVSEETIKEFHDDDKMWETADGLGSKPWLEGDAIIAGSLGQLQPKRDNVRFKHHAAPIIIHGGLVSGFG